jgi:hypothetical protein
MQTQTQKPKLPTFFLASDISSKLQQILPNYETSTFSISQHTEVDQKRTKSKRVGKKPHRDRGADPLTDRVMVGNN